jgi:hypothetical protein
MSVTTAVKPATAPAKITLVVGATNITSRLAALKTVMANAQAETHVLACSILSHVGKHRDVRLVTTMLESLGDMVRKNAVKSWFEAHGPVKFDDKGAISFDKSRPLQLAKAMGTPFWKFKPEAEYQPLQMDKTFDRWIKMLETDQTKAGRDHSGLIAQLLAIRPVETAERDAANATVAATADAPAETPAVEAPVVEAAPKAARQRKAA